MKRFVLLTVILSLCLPCAAALADEAQVNINLTISTELPLFPQRAAAI